MDQAELEDEIFTKTICTHLSMLLEYISTYSSDFNSMFTISHRREFFLYSMAVIIAILIWMLQSGVLSKRFEPFNFISKGISSLDNQVWQETEKNGIASGKREISFILPRHFRNMTSQSSTVHQFKLCSNSSILSTRQETKHGGQICSDRMSASIY